MWMHVQEASKKISLKKLETVMLGDSRAKVMYLPAKKNEINLALGGATPIEGYFTLKNIAGNGRSNDGTLLLSYAPFHLERQDSFWGRTVTFNFLNIKDLLVLLIENVPNNNSYFRMSVAGCLKRLLTPWFYLNSFFKGFRWQRWKANAKMKEYVESHNGHAFFGRSKKIKHHGRLPNRQFRPAELSTKYLKKIQSDAVANGIRKIYYVSSPYPYVRTRFSEKYLSEFNTYISKMGITMLIPPSFCPNDWYGDPSHLYKGHEYYSELIDLMLENYNKPKTIVNFSTSALRRVKKDGYPWNAQDCIQMNKTGLIVQFEDVKVHERLNISVDNNDRYFLQFESDTQAFGIFLDRVNIKGGGVAAHNVSLPAIPFKRMSVVPVTGDGRYSIAHIKFAG